MRDLGVVIDSKLNFASHVSRIVSRANRALGLLIRSFQTGARGTKFNQKTLLATYFANVRSILEYSCVVWAGAAKSDTERVDRVHCAAQVSDVAEQSHDRTLPLPILQITPEPLRNPITFHTQNPI